MVRYVSWLINSALFILCCFLVANTANAIIAALLSEPPTAAMEADPVSETDGRDWSERQQIIDRNLFHSSVLTAQAVAEPESLVDLEELEETELPLKLWGTIASANPADSWASIEELSERSTTAVRVGDEISQATVVGIERQRVVLLEDGKRRSLSLDEEGPVGSGRSHTGSLRAMARSRRSEARQPTARSTSRSSPRGASSASGRTSMRERIQQLSEDRVEVERDEVEKVINNPATLLSQARILPKINSEGGVAGLEISAIQPDSVFEQMGIEDGELITEIDGVPIGDFEEHSQIMSALTDDGGATLTVEGGSDGPRSLDLVPN